MTLLLSENLFFVLQISIAIAVMMWVAIEDVRRRRIPNTAVLILLVVSLLLHVGHGGWWGCALWGLGLLIGFVAFFVLHVLGAVGAGDVKLMGASCALTGLNLVAPMLIVTLLLVGCMAVAFLVARSKSKTLPCGVAIGTSTIICLTLQAIHVWSQ